jgi:hypothetical protein
MIFTQPIIDVIMNPPIRDVKGFNAFYPSSASVKVQDPDLGIPRVIGGPNACLRNQYYEIKGVPPTNYPNPQGVLKMEAGGYIQSMIEEKLKQAGLWIGSEKRLWIPKYKLSGRVDTWAWDPESLQPGRKRVPIMVEFKSMGRFQESGPIRPSKGSLMPKDEHICQVVPYLDYFSQFPEAFHGEPVRCVIFAIGRDSFEWKEHVVQLAGRGQYGMDLKDDERFVVVRNEMGTFQLKYITVSGIYTRFMELAGYLRAKQVPPRDFMVQYDNEVIHRMFEKDLLTKKDRELLVRGKKEDPEGKNPWISKGDWQCVYCGFKDKCWQGIDHTAKPVIHQNLPTHAEPRKPPVTESVGKL